MPPFPDDVYAQNGYPPPNAPGPNAGFTMQMWDQFRAWRDHRKREYPADPDPTYADYQNYLQFQQQFAAYHANGPPPGIPFPHPPPPPPGYFAPPLHGAYSKPANAPEVPAPRNTKRQRTAKQDKKRAHRAKHAKRGDDGDDEDDPDDSSDDSDGDEDKDDESDDEEPKGRLSADLILMKKGAKLNKAQKQVKKRMKVRIYSPFTPLCARICVLKRK